MQATIYSITPFDKSIGTTVTYNWNGTQKYVQVTVRSGPQESDSVIYQGPNIETNLKQVPIPQDSGLANGNAYYAFVKITDSNNNYNDNYNVGKLFYCRATPTFVFEWNDTETPVTNGKRYLSTFSFPFTVRYEQSDGEKLNSWSISLYTADHIMISTSGTMYNVQHNGNQATLSYQFSGFSDSNDYAIRAQGITQNGINVDTGYIGITSNYSTRAIFAVLNAENKPNDGKIYIHSNIVSSMCKVYDDEDVEVPENQLKPRGLLYSGDYTDPDTNETTNGDHALILPSGYRMEIDDGFTLGGDFSNVLIFINPALNTPLLTYVSDDGEHDVVLYYRVGKFTSDWQSSPSQLQACFELVANGTIRDVYFSNVINKLDTDQRVGVVIVRDSGRFNIVAYDGLKLKDGAIAPVESYAESISEDVG